MRAAARPSLKARAIALLAQREHSRSELRRKLLRQVRADLRHAQQLAHIQRPSAGRRPEPVATAGPGMGVDQSDVEAGVDALLETLEVQGLLSAERFVASRVRVRAPRHGTERIRRELAEHGLALEPEQRSELEQSEMARAVEVWHRKFGAPASDAAGRARQARFLAARGFASEVIRRVVAGRVDPDGKSKV